MTKRLSAAEAVEELFQLYADDVYRYAVSVLGKPAEAEDVVQEVFIRVLKSWDKFRYESSVKTWLWSIARNCIQDVHRKRYRRKEQLTEEGVLPDRLAHDADEHIVELEDTLRGLSESYRQVVTLRLIQDLSTEDTARILGWTTAKVRTTLHRAVNALRSIMQPEVPVSSVRAGKEREPYGV
jgi:RNA polymerase sigma-70 factor (ECF subfamily)